MNSYWLCSIKNNLNTKVIDDNYLFDVCIIGAGIVGLSTGYYLSKMGLKVAIVDKSEVGAKASGHTTAKITLQHGLIYSYLNDTFGLDTAYSYFKANKEAISNIKNIIDSENIDCDFEYQDNYIYTNSKSDIEKINNEVLILNKLGGNGFAEFTSSSSLPFKITGAVKTKNQAEFHPVKYMYGLANCILNYGGTIFTNSLVTDVQRNNDEFITYVNNYHIKSRFVVMASHYPIINFPGFYFSKMYQCTSYAIGIAVNNDINGMYINTGEPVLSFRTAKLENSNNRLLILGGGSHKTGFAPDSNSIFGYEFLKKEAEKLFPNCDIKYKWNTRDCVTLDKIPYIGDFSSFMPNMYVATGFNKWGMTTSNVAANIIKDRILGNNNVYAKTFDSSRFGLLKNKDEMKNMVKQVFNSFVGNRIKIPDEDLSKIKKDNGGIVKINGTAVGIYKDSDGDVFAVNPTCTHLGCLLTWNNVDKTWDCPCHGSRFDYTGKNLYDPAFKDLETYKID